MINKQKTLKLIKEKVDSKTSGKVKLKRPFLCEFKEGTFRHTTCKKIVSLFKQGNSVMWVDENYMVRNINILETKDLHIILWQLINDKEKKEIALEHLLETKTYLNSI